MKRLSKALGTFLLFYGFQGISIHLPAFAQTEFDTPLTEVQSLYYSGQYFKAARYAFQIQGQSPAIQAEAQAWIAISLHRAGLSQASTYFFIKTLLLEDRTAIRKVLPITQELMVRVGADVLRRYLVLKTTAEDYDSQGRAAFRYSLGKEMLLRGRYNEALRELTQISNSSPLYPFSLQMKGTAHALLGQNALAVQSFEDCIDQAQVYENYVVKGPAGFDALRSKIQVHESNDLRARCQAGIARTQYQAELFNQADRSYDRIPKSSLVWPDILFEQGWNGFAKSEYNRTLGKLVSYKSPALQFVYNSEIEVLRAQTYLNLCLYSDAGEAIQDFYDKYSSLGRSLKNFVEQKSNQLEAFYNFGKAALKDSLYTKNEMHRVANRFVRSSYFENLVLSEVAIQRERRAIEQFARNQVGVQYSSQEGFPGFLGLVLNWRLNSVQSIAGAFVKNSLIDYHQALVADFEKVAFLKLEMLERAKNKLIKGEDPSELRGRGNAKPKRRDDQYLWSFNGEFWSDELGDYIFGLESECEKNK